MSTKLIVYKNIILTVILHTQSHINCMDIHFQTITIVLHLNTEYFSLFQDYMNRHQRVQGNKKAHTTNNEYYTISHISNISSHIVRHIATHDLFKNITYNTDECVISVAYVSLIKPSLIAQLHTIIPCNLQMHT